VASRIIRLDGDEVAEAVFQWLERHGFHIEGPRTLVWVSDQGAEVHLDPSASLEVETR
jgi:hypothetical protein